MPATYFPETVGEMVDKYGDVRIVHRRANGRLAVKRQGQTVSLNLNRTIAYAVSNNIRRLRKKAGLTYAELASRAGMPGGKQQAYHMENPTIRGSVKLGTVYAVAIALGVKLSDILPRPTDVLDKSDIEWGTDEQGSACLFVTEDNTLTETGNGSD